MTKPPIFSTTTVAPHPETFIRLCLLWTALHRTTRIPPACKGVLTEEHIAALQSRAELGKLLNSLEESGKGPAYIKPDFIAEDPNEDRERKNNHNNNHIKYQFRYTSRSLSVIG